MNSIITAMTAVFTAIFTWIESALNSIVSVFYSPTDGLTFFGILSLSALGISLFFLIMRVIQNFLHFRG